MQVDGRHGGSDSTVGSARPTRARVEGALDHEVADQAGIGLHASPEDALRWVLSAFEQRDTAATAHLWIDQARTPDRASVYRLDGKVVMIVGQDPLARSVLPELLPLNGWILHRLPVPGTPLAALKNELGFRAYNMLARAGFATVEEVATAPDLGLYNIRGMGEGTLELVRAVTYAANASYVYPGDDEVMTLSGRQVRELGALLATLTAYAQTRGHLDIVRRTKAFVADALQPSDGEPWPRRENRS